MSAREPAAATIPSGVDPRHGARRLVVATGPSGQGKTTAVLDAVARLRSLGLDVAGVVQPARYDDHGRAAGYDVEDLRSGERALLAAAASDSRGEHGTRFSFDADGFRLAARALKGSECSVLVLDEIGPVELRGGGHAPALTSALHDRRAAVLLATVRPRLLPACVAWLSARDVVIVRVGEDARPGARLAAAAGELVAASRASAPRA